MSGGVSVVIPFAFRPRFHLLVTTVEWLRRCAAVDQIIISEMGTEPIARDLAREHGVEYLFTYLEPPFDKVRIMNAGFALARNPVIFWLDCDFIFDREFVKRALAEMRAAQADYFFPNARIDYLSEQDSAAVAAAARLPQDCVPIRQLVTADGSNPGGMGMVRADFLRRVGGMIEGFRGWGCEDDAWLHKARLLGKVECSHDPRQLIWHLYHPDSGMVTPDAMQKAVRSNPHHPANLRLVNRIFAVSSGAEFLRQFPPPPHIAPPWPPCARLGFVAAAADRSAPTAVRARAWATRIGEIYGDAPTVALVNPANPDPALAKLGGNALVGFADDAAGAHALTNGLGNRLRLLVADISRPAAVPRGSVPWPMVLARTDPQRKAWLARAPVWHRAWKDLDGLSSPGIAPPLVGPLSAVLGTMRLWRVEIALERQALAHPALDRPRFWYVGLHDADDTELLRQDLDGPELHRLLSDPDQPLVIERHARSPVAPARWTIWPTDRHGRWLEKITGPARAIELDLQHA